MPPTFEHTFKVRFYECDPYGRLNNANYLRYATEAAIEASIAAGCDLTQGDTRWALQEAGIEFLRPAAQGESLIARTRMSDWRNESVSLEQEFLLSGEHAAAKVCTDWEFVAFETGEPCPPPTRVLAGFYPGGLPPESPARTPFPEPPRAPDGAFVARRQVRWSHLNPLGWLDYGHYLSLMEEVVIDAAEYVGWTMQKAAEHGVAFYAKDHHVEFLSPVGMRDELRITTYIGEVGETSAVRYYVFEEPRSGVVARAQTTWVWVNPETGRPAPISDDWWEDFEDQIADG
jgi:acyl-CoA thioester hydrolase